MPPVRDLWLPVTATTGLLLGATVWPVAPVWADRLWITVLVVTGGVVVAGTARGAIRGRWASDIIAALAIVVAAAMRQPLPGLTVVLMQTGGEALERFAEGRASDAVRALEADRPQLGHVLRGDGFVDVPASAIVVGDVLAVRPGDLVPCDGVVTDGSAEPDTSRLTGEPLSVAAGPGAVVRSGSINGSRPFTMRSTAQAGGVRTVVIRPRSSPGDSSPHLRHYSGMTVDGLATPGRSG